MQHQSDEASQPSSTRKSTLREKRYLHPDGSWRPTPYRMTPEVADGVQRLIMALGKRVAVGDPGDLLILRSLATTVREAEAVAVAGLREQGHSDQVIATELGCSRQAVEQRWPRRAS